MVASPSRYDGEDTRMWRGRGIAVTEEHLSLHAGPILGSFEGEAGCFRKKIFM